MEKFEEMCSRFDKVSIWKRGGQKLVYSAVNKDYGECVIKLYFELNDPRAKREIDIEKNIEIGYVPQIYETGFVEYEGLKTLYVVEEKINGTELRTIINEGKRFSLQEAFDFLEQGLEFIQYLEEQGIVHRDIKPENIIVKEDGKIIFIDFGIARIVGGTSLTRTEALLGPHTPGYAAPEQFNNMKKEIDSRTDMFSLAVVTYECLTGINPFRKNANNALEILQNTETITPVTYRIEGDSQMQFMGLLSSMMAKYLSRRPKNAKQALNWLEASKRTLKL